MTKTSRAITNGLTPGKLEHLLRGHACVSDIAAIYLTDVATVQLLMRRWGLDYLSGREKSNVTLVRNCQ